MNTTTALLSLGRGVTPERLRRALERLGPTFVKIGQYLSLRPDLLDERYCNELLKLVDRVPAEPFAMAERVIVADLGGRLQDHFTFIAKQPVGSASLSQVYEARTHRGIDVAVKVQRAGVAARVQADLRRLRWLVRLLEATGDVQRAFAGDVMGELRRWMAEELDLEHELSNLTQIYRHARGSHVLVVPRPYPALSGPHVITTEFLRGVPFSVLLRAVREGMPEAVDRLGFDSRLLAENLIEAMLEQIFRFRVFQADSHPGNIIALPGNRIGFVDFGLVEALDPVLEAGLFRYVRAIYLSDFEEMLRGLDEILVPGERADPAAFRRDFLEESRRWRTERSARSAAGSPVGQYMMGVLRAARRSDMRLPTGILAIYRSLLTAEMVAHQLAADVNLGSVGGDFFRRLQRETLLRLPDVQTIEADIIATLEMLRAAPRKLDRLISDLTSDRFRLRVEQNFSLPERRQRADQARLVVAGLIWVGLSVLLAGSRNLIGFDWLPLVLQGALVTNALLVIVLWRRLP